MESCHVIDRCLTTLFVGDLSVYCTNEELYSLLDHYDIHDVIIKMKNNRSCCYGFVRFYSIESAELCLQEMNGVLFKGRNIKFLRESSCQRLKVQNADENIFVNENNYRGIFGIYGEVEKVELVYSSKK